MNKSEKLIHSLTDDDAALFLALLGTGYANSKDETAKRNIDLLFNYIEFGEHFINFLKFGISMEEFLDGVGIDKIMEKAQQECGCENCPDDDEDEEEDEDDDELEDNEDVKEQVIGFMLKGVSKKTAEKLEKIQKQLNRTYDAQDPSIITSAELLELSFVTIPANPEALSLMKSLGLSGEMLSKSAEMLAIEALSLEIADIKALIQTLADGKAKEEKDFEAKEALQNANRAVSDALRSFKVKQ